jgi:hypothetical protein
MKPKRKICIPAMHEAFRRVFGTDAPAIVVLACEKSPKTRREVERIYQQVMREQEFRRADQ